MERWSVGVLDLDTLTITPLLQYPITPFLLISALPLFPRTCYTLLTRNDEER
jgi:hypothetical protein